MSDFVSLDITGMTCGHCTAAVAHAVRTVPAVTGAEVRIGHAALTIAPGASAADVARAAIEAVRAAGYDATLAGATPAIATMAPTSCCAPPRGAATSR